MSGTQKAAAAAAFHKGRLWSRTQRRTLLILACSCSRPFSLSLPWATLQKRTACSQMGTTLESAHAVHAGSTPICCETQSDKSVDSKQKQGS
eukprot:1134742-Pelagomonas_calceolata.AAC.1